MHLNLFNRIPQLKSTVNARIVLPVLFAYLIVSAKIIYDNLLFLNSGTIMAMSYIAFIITVYASVRYLTPVAEQASVKIPALGILETKTFQNMLQKWLMVFRLGNVFEHYFANLFRINFFNKNNNIRHKQFPGLHNNLGRKLVMGNPK
jgi:hypothetical protein